MNSAADLIKSLRVSMTQLMGAPVQYGLLAALCIAYSRKRSDLGGMLFCIRWRTGALRHTGKLPVTINSDDALSAAQRFLRRLVRAFDEMSDANANICVMRSAFELDDIEIEVTQALGATVVLRPVDPALNGEWRFEFSSGVPERFDLGRAWADATSELAHCLQGESMVDVSRALAGRHGGGASEPVLTLVHGADGSVVPFAPLAVRLSIPLRAVRCLPESVAACASVQELASRYADRLIEIEMGDTHWVGGHSFGAVVACEMASYLQARGKRVLPVISLDPSLALAARERSSDRHTELVTLFKGLFPPEEAERFFATSVRDADIEQRLRLRMSQARISEVLVTRARCLALLRTYRDRLDSAVEAVHLHASDPLLPEWTALALKHRQPGVEVPGNHFSMLMEPHVEQIASVINSVSERIHD